MAQFGAVPSKEHVVEDFREPEGSFIEATVDGPVPFQGSHLRFQVPGQAQQVIPEEAHRSEQDQFVQVLEIVVEGGTVVPGLGGDPPDGHSGDSLFLEDFLRGFHKIHHVPLLPESQFLSLLFLGFLILVFHMGQGTS